MTQRPSFTDDIHSVKIQQLHSQVVRKLALVLQPLGAHKHATAAAHPFLQPALVEVAVVIPETRKKITKVVGSRGVADRTR